MISAPFPPDEFSRSALIEDRRAKPKSHKVIPFRGALRSVEVIELPIEALLFRIHNGRTRVKQLRYVADRNLDATFFDRGDSSAGVQDAQGKILLEMSRDEKADVYSELARVASQTEPFIITASGVIVDGNRRVAAMRELLKKEPGKYRSFRNIEVAVLPAEADEQDIEDVETELQETPETKLDYDWIARRLKIRYQIEQLRLSPKSLKDRYRVGSADDITREVLQLALAEDYLAFIKKDRTEYWEVSQNEEIFKRLQAALANAAPEEMELKKLLGFNLIKQGQAGEIEDRLYRYHPIFGKKLNEVLGRIAEDGELPVADAIPAKLSEQGASVEDDPLTALEDSEPAMEENKSRLLAALKSAEAPAVLTSMISAYDEMVKEKQQGDQKLLPQKNAIAANRLLNDINVSVADPATIPTITSQLTAIIATAQKLLAQVS